MRQKKTITSSSTVKVYYKICKVPLQNGSHLIWPAGRAV